MINYFIDAVFIADIVISFMTTVKDPLTGDEITKPSHIALAYLKGRFFMDLVSSIPFDIIADDSSVSRLKVFQIMKLIRIMRFTRIISYMSAVESIKLSLKLMKLIFYLIVYLHIQACAWFFYTK